MDNKINQFAKYIKEIRESKHLTVYQIWKQSGFSQATWSRIENGQREPNPETIRTISKILEIPYVELLRIANHITEQDIQEYLDWKKD